ncbi:MAG: alkylhydroperoxidase [Alphaproteobacteria bacterium HGW-Alphaproteobacteria-2]|nr:MAG: alkylhydroperoxidase [Alphaproteobacteria bacterium HGW-Alphaproteobacteria-2]
MSQHILDLPHVEHAEAEGEAKRVLDKAKAGVGFVPNMYKAMVNSPGLLETYLDGYARFRASGVFTPAEQEVVFLTISDANGCGYCMAAHTMLALHKSGVGAADVEALRAGKPLPTAKLEALRAFTRHLWDTRARPTKEAVRAFHAAGYSDRHILELVLACAVKTLSNWSNHLTEPAVDEVFAAHKVAAA